MQPLASLSLCRKHLVHLTSLHVAPMDHGPVPSTDLLYFFFSFNDQIQYNNRLCGRQNESMALDNC